MRARHLWLVLCATAVLCVNGAQAGPISVFVSIHPQAYLLERLGGTEVKVSVLVPPGQGPHTFEPAPKTVAALASASTYFTVGLPFEKRLLEKVTKIAPSLRVVDSSAGITRRTMETHAEEGDTHEEHGAADPHVWLCPANGKNIAANMAIALKQLLPGSAAAIDANLATLQKELDALDHRIAAMLAPYKGSVFYVYHPAFGYFADAYGLKQAAVEIDGKEPTAKELAALIERARQDDVHVIFVQPQYSRKPAEAVAAAIHGVVTPVDSLAHDYPGCLQDIAGKLRDGFAKHAR